MKIQCDCLRLEIIPGRILAQFSDTLPQSQQIPDALAELGALVRAITAVSITQVVFSD